MNDTEPRWDVILRCRCRHHHRDMVSIALAGFRENQKPFGHIESACFEYELVKPELQQDE